MFFVLSSNNNNCKKLSSYSFTREYDVQSVLVDNPEIILETLECQYDPNNIAICQEFQCIAGKIDVLYITPEPSIIVVETKLYSNPESKRIVIAQLVDYIKSLSLTEAKIFWKNVLERSKKPIDKSIFNETFEVGLEKALKSGDVRGVILGDSIQSNVLEIAESIQSAPHLFFTIIAVSLNPARYLNDVVFFPKIESKTKEVQRSVINIDITFDGEKKYQPQITVQSRTEETDNTSQVNRAKLTWEQYLLTIEPQEFAVIIDEYKKKYIDMLQGKCTMGFVGFSLTSSGFAQQFIYNKYLYLISQVTVDRNKVNPVIFSEYKDELQAIPEIYDRHVVGGRLKVDFSSITKNKLEIILQAGFNFAKKIIET